MKANKGNVRCSRPAPVRQKLCSALLLALVACSAPTWAQRNDAPQAYSISAGDLAGALDQLASQSKVQIIYPAELVRGKRAAAVSGQQTWREALQKLLVGTGLTYGFVNDTTVVIRKSDKAERPAAAAPPAPVPAQRNPQPEPQDLEKMTVTGTRIRGGSTPSPVITIGSERILEEGFTDLGEVIRSIPQNFTGGQNPGVLMGNVIGAGLANQNMTGGSALNLRGLGPDASLTLLNGRRMSYGGMAQAVDISAIPVEAVERIEIVADGASAIYGSDAVGGVANVVLQRDFEGFALGARFGTATDGGRHTRDYTATAGTTWDTGGFIATYKDASVDPVYSRQRVYTAHLLEPQMILPGSDARSGLLSIHQSAGDTVQIRLDALRTERDQIYNYYGASPALYNILTPRTAISLVAPSIEFSLPNDWMMSLGGTWGKGEHVQDHSRYTFATQAITPLIYDCLCNKSRTYEFGAEGPLFDIGGRDVRLALGAGYRENEFVQPNFLTGANTIEGQEGSRFVYAEINLPIVGADSSVSGVRRLELTAAMRGEDYDSFGSVSTPKMGLIYGLSSDFTIKTSWGKSFKAPTLFQLFRAHSAQISPAVSFGGGAFPAGSLVLLDAGGHRDLEPERARVWTASLSFHPESIPGLESELAWFDIDYTDRVVEPFTNFAQALTNPAFAEFVQFSPSAEEQASIIESADRFVVTGGATYAPDRVVAILHARYINAARQRVRGLDLSGSYRFDVGAGRMTIRGAATLLDSSQQTTTTTFDLSGMLHNPARIASRIGAVWTQGGFTASAFANYKSGVENVVEDETLASFTTFDVTLRHALSGDRTALSGLEFALTLQNAFNRPPSLYTVASDRQHVPPYDSMNYSAVGRFVSLSVSKRW